MKWETLLDLVGGEPVFASALLLAGRVSEPQVRVQLARWVKADRLLQLRRGLYCLAPPWRKVEPHPFLVANALHRGSYVSLQSALAFHGVIPEHVPVVTSVGCGRPAAVENPLGTFRLHHVASSLLVGFDRLEVAFRQLAFVATPEKALLDLIYLTPGADAAGYIRELRLQNPGAVHPRNLLELAQQSGKPKLLRAARLLLSLLPDEGDDVP